MEISLREGVYIGSVLAAWVVGWVKFNNKLVNQWKDTETRFLKAETEIESNKKDIDKLTSFFKKVLLDDNGEIRLVDKITFNAEIKKGDIEHKDINKQLVEVDKKLLLIIIHMGIGEDDTKILKKV